jgi:hypothetical protein
MVKLLLKKEESTSILLFLPYNTKNKCGSDVTKTDKNPRLGYASCCVRLHDILYVAKTVAYPANRVPHQRRIFNYFYYKCERSTFN